MNENNVNPNPVDDVKEENTEPLTEEINEVAEESAQETEVVQDEAEVQETEDAQADVAEETDDNKPWVSMLCDVCDCTPPAEYLLDETCLVTKVENDTLLFL